VWLKKKILGGENAPEKKVAFITQSHPGLRVKPRVVVAPSTRIVAASKLHLRAYTRARTCTHPNPRMREREREKRRYEQNEERKKKQNLPKPTPFESSVVYARVP